MKTLLVAIAWLSGLFTLPAPAAANNALACEKEYKAHLTVSREAHQVPPDVIAELDRRLQRCALYHLKNAETLLEAQPWMSYVKDPGFVAEARPTVERLVEALLKGGKLPDLHEAFVKMHGFDPLEPTRRYFTSNEVARINEAYHAHWFAEADAISALAKQPGDELEVIERLARLSSSTAQWSFYDRLRAVRETTMWMIVKREARSSNPHAYLLMRILREYPELLWESELGELTFETLTRTLRDRTDLEELRILLDRWRQVYSWNNSAWIPAMSAKIELRLKESLNSTQERK